MSRIKTKSHEFFNYDVQNRRLMTGIVSLNLPGGSTLQLDVGRGLL